VILLAPVVTAISVTAALLDSEDPENSCVSVGAAAESERTDAEFLMGNPRKRFEVVRRFTPRVVDDVIKLRRETLTPVLVETIELPFRAVGELPVSPFTHRRPYLPSRLRDRIRPSIRR
jgi:hypothetical protein